MANRKCQRCKQTFPMDQLEKIGKNQFICWKTSECYGRILERNKMDTLLFSIEGSFSDLDFLKQRFDAALEEVIEEYKSHLDGEVTVDWNWKK